MFNLKQRFKKAIFAFFRNEILDLVGYDLNNQNNQNMKFKQTSQHQIVNSEMKFTEIKTEILLNNNTNHGYNEPFSVFYEKELENAKMKLIENALKFIQVDTSYLIDKYIHPDHRKISLSLFVGNKI